MTLGPVSRLPKRNIFLFASLRLCVLAREFRARPPSKLKKLLTFDVDSSRDHPELFLRSFDGRGVLSTIFGEISENYGVFVAHRVVKKSKGKKRVSDDA